MKTYTLEELHEIYNELKLKWGFVDTKEFLELLEYRRTRKMILKILLWVLVIHFLLNILIARYFYFYIEMRLTSSTHKQR